MAFDPCFLELMASTITVQGSSTRDAYGAPTRTAAVSVRAKVSYGSNRELGVQADDGVWAVTVHTPPPGHVPEEGLFATPRFELDDLINLPDGTSGVVANIDRPTDEDGSIHHQRLMLKASA